MMVLKLINQVQNYSWGSTDYIPTLLGKDFNGAHCAELWMGDHPRGTSSAIVDNRKISLDQLILKDPKLILGNDVSRFGSHLPFLFKVLSAASPLSIQAHPNKIQAETGFLDENTRNIPLDAFNRNYKDNNHKPEIICALTNFTAMCGFRKSNIIETNFTKLNSSVFKNQLKNCFDTGVENNTEAFFSALMRLDKKNLRNLIESALVWAGTNISLEAKLVKKFAALYKNDPGILSPLFLNVFRLKPGEALYQGAGELHAYVEGTGIELMANSDNVLRGGLTPKYIDVPELLKVLNFKYTEKSILNPKEIKSGIFEYETISREFVLKTYSVGKNNILEVENNGSVEIILCIKGNAVIHTKDGDFPIAKGESFIIPASSGSYALSGVAEIYSAGIPGMKEV